MSFNANVGKRGTFSYYQQSAVLTENTPFYTPIIYGQFSTFVLHIIKRAGGFTASQQLLLGSTPDPNKFEAIPFLLSSVTWAATGALAGTRYLCAPNATTSATYLDVPLTNLGAYFPNAFPYGTYTGAKTQTNVVIPPLNYACFVISSGTPSATTFTADILAYGY